MHRGTRTLLRSFILPLNDSHAGCPAESLLSVRTRAGLHPFHPDDILNRRPRPPAHRSRAPCNAVCSLRSKALAAGRVGSPALLACRVALPTLRLAGAIPTQIIVDCEQLRVTVVIGSGFSPRVSGGRGPAVALAGVHAHRTLRREGRHRQVAIYFGWSCVTSEVSQAGMPRFEVTHSWLLPAKS